MLLNNQEKRPITLFIPDKKGTATKPYMFIPGNQEIEDSAWKLLKAQPGVQRILKQGKLREVAAPVKDNKKSGKGLAKYGAEQAEFIIAETFDKRLLGDWLATETRSVIKTAIEAQLAVIEKSVTRKKKDDDE